MRSRLVFVLGAGLGYVLGTRAGREQYEQLTAKAQELWRHPKVQGQVNDAQDALTAVVSDHVPTLARKAVHAARDTLGMELPKE